MNSTLRIAVSTGIVLLFVGLVAITYCFDAPDPADSERYVLIDLAETGAANRVAGIVLNLRLFDTLLEILVFSVAVLGVRHYLSHSEVKAAPQQSESSIVRAAATLLGPLALLLSTIFAIFGHISPGGGFAAGVIAASAVLYASIAQGMQITETRVNPTHVATLEKVILLLVLAWILVPAISGRAPLTDLLPKGTPGNLLSGGSILPYNVLVAVKVLLGAWLVIAAFSQHRGDL